MGDIRKRLHRIVRFPAVRWPEESRKDTVKRAIAYIAIWMTFELVMGGMLPILILFVTIGRFWPPPAITQWISPRDIYLICVALAATRLPDLFGENNLIEAFSLSEGERVKDAEERAAVWGMQAAVEGAKPPEEQIPLPHQEATPQAPPQESIPRIIKPTYANKGRRPAAEASLYLRVGSGTTAYSMFSRTVQHTMSLNRIK